MDRSSIPKAVCNELKQGKQDRGAPKKCFKDQFKQQLLQAGIDYSGWEQIAGDRALLGALVKAATEQLEEERKLPINRHQTKEKKAGCHTTKSTTPSFHLPPSAPTDSVLNYRIIAEYEIPITGLLPSDLRIRRRIAVCKMKLSLTSFLWLTILNGVLSKSGTVYLMMFCKLSAELLFCNPNLTLFNYAQAEGLTRHFNILNLQYLLLPDIDDCSPNPCRNGATCADKVNSYTCSCIEGYTGYNCSSGTSVSRLVCFVFDQTEEFLKRKTQIKKCLFPELVTS